MCKFSRKVVALAVCGMLATGTASSREILIVAANLPPMISQTAEGHEASIIRETLAACGHTVKFKVVPFVRHWTEFKGGSYDAVTTVPPEMALGGVHSSVYIRYQNGVSVLRARNLPIKNLADLKGSSAIAFKGARDILPGLSQAIPSLSRYDENTDQLIHSNLLFGKRVDVVIGDGLIFAEYNRQLQHDEKSGKTLSFDPHQAVVFTAIFPPTPYTMVFKDTALRDDFNRCFGQLSQSGRIDAVLKAAIVPYRATIGTQYLGY